MVLDRRLEPGEHLQGKLVASKEDRRWPLMLALEVIVVTSESHSATMTAKGWRAPFSPSAFSDPSLEGSLALRPKFAD